MLMCNLGTSLATARAKVRAINYALGLPRVVPSPGRFVASQYAVESSAVRLLYRTSDTSYYIRWTTDVASVAGVTNSVTLRDGTTESVITPASDTGDVASATVLGMTDQGADYMQRIAGAARIMLCGDSWTVGTADPDLLGYRVPLSTLMTNTLQVGIATSGSWTQAHCGFAGAQVTGIQFAIENRVWALRQPDAEPHVCVIFAGLNDVLTSANDAAAVAKAGNVGTFITYLRTTFSGARVLHVRIPTYTGTPGAPTTTTRIGLYNAAVQTVLDAHAAHADGSLTRVDLTSTLTDPADLGDAVPHPSVAGFAKLAAALAPAVTAAIGTRV
jgi:lysophospholipase L1-like esterase